MISNPWEDDGTGPVCVDCDDPEPVMVIERFNRRIGVRDRVWICQACADALGLTDDPTDDGDATYDIAQEDGAA